MIVEKDFLLAGPFRGRLKGQNIVLRDTLGTLNAIAWSDRENAYVGVSDPRARGSTERFRAPQLHEHEVAATDPGVPPGHP